MLSFLLTISALGQSAPTQPPERPVLRTVPSEAVVVRDRARACGKERSESPIAMQVDDLIGLTSEGGASPVDQISISKFEASAGYHLPPDFRDLVLRKNGGRLQNTLEARWRSQLYQGGEGNALLDKLFSVGGGEQGEVRSIAAELEEMEHEIADVPAGIFVIGGDDLGNLVTIDLRPSSYGQIALVDHELIQDPFPDEESYQVIANSFTEFVAMLRPAEDC
jgi:cell wall assembly regulator SMI1